LGRALRNSEAASPTSTGYKQYYLKNWKVFLLSKVRNGRRGMRFKTENKGEDKIKKALKCFFYDYFLKSFF